MTGLRVLAADGLGCLDTAADAVGEAGATDRVKDEVGEAGAREADADGEMGARDAAADEDADGETVAEGEGEGELEVEVVGEGDSEAEAAGRLRLALPDAVALMEVDAPLDGAAGDRLGDGVMRESSSTMPEGAGRAPRTHEG